MARRRALDVMKLAADLSKAVGGTTPAAIAGGFRWSDRNEAAKFTTYSPEHNQKVVVVVAVFEDGNVSVDFFSDEHLSGRFENIGNFLYGPDGYTSRKIDVNEMKGDVEWVWKTVDGYAASWQQDDDQVDERAHEARGGSIRERFDRLRASCLKTYEERSQIRRDMHVKYGPEFQTRWASRGEQTKLEKARARQNKADDAMFAFIQEISPRDWSGGVPVGWVVRELTFEDAVRPKGEPLSVVPPLSYGATRPLAAPRESRVVHSTAMDHFINGYFDAALWAETDDNDQPFDKNYSSDDIDEATADKMQKDCEDFVRRFGSLIDDDEPTHGGGFDRWEVAGHDFWLTRNGHGAGFWDGDWPKHGDELTKASKEYGEFYLYVGDDGKIHGPPPGAYGVRERRRPRRRTPRR